MSKLVSIGVAEAPYVYPQCEVKRFVSNLLSDSPPSLKMLTSVFDNATIERRHFIMEKEWYSQRRSFVERNERYVECGVALASSALIQCLEETGVSPTDVDHVILVSSTGVATPTIDAILFNKHKLSPHVRRTPIWGLGCLGGAVGLSRAMEYTTAFPNSIALVVALEICSLAFQIDDLTPSGIIASALFSDGASAALVAGRENHLYALRGLELIDSQSTTYRDSLHVMGWEIVDEGFKVILSKEIPAIVKANIRGVVTQLLSKHRLSISEISHFPAHPGGVRVLAAYKEALMLPPGALRHSKEVLKHHGNMSSPTVHFVLNRLLREENNPGAYGIISALGPGFSSELLLFRTA